MRIFYVLAKSCKWEPLDLSGENPVVLAQTPYRERLKPPGHIFQILSSRNYWGIYEGFRVMPSDNKQQDPFYKAWIKSGNWNGKAEASEVTGIPLARINKWESGEEQIPIHFKTNIVFGKLIKRTNVKRAINNAFNPENT